MRYQLFCFGRVECLYLLYQQFDNIGRENKLLLQTEPKLQILNWTRKAAMKKNIYTQQISSQTYQKDLWLMN